jgi:hypothetical protein
VCRCFHVKLSSYIDEVSSAHTPGIDGNSSPPLISNGRSTLGGDHGDGRSSCMSPRGCLPLSASLSALWDSILRWSLIVTFVAPLSAVTSSIRHSRASCTGLATRCACMIDFPCFNLKLIHPPPQFTAWFAAASASFLLVLRGCAVPPSSFTVTVSNILILY